MTIRKPLLSVIVAHYNNAPFIKECLDSIIEQSFRDFEIIICDDCSTDDSSEIIKGYEKKYPRTVKAIFNPVNRGVARTRHEAILLAKGDYITTLDSDDYYYNSRKLEHEMLLIQYRKKTENKDVIAFSNIVCVRGDRSLIGCQGNAGNIRQGKILNEIISRACLIPRDFILAKDVYFEAGGYDFRFPIYEDWDLKIRLAKKYEFYYTGINGTAYRKHGAGLSSLPLPQHTKWMNKIFRKNLNLVDRINKREVKKNFKRVIKIMKAKQNKKV